MALQTKKRWAQLKVGLLAISALCILAVLIFLMTSSTGLFTKRSKVYTFLDDSAALLSATVTQRNHSRKSVGCLAFGSNEPNRIVRSPWMWTTIFCPRFPWTRSRHRSRKPAGTKYNNIKGAAQLRSLPGRDQGPDARIRRRSQQGYARSLRSTGFSRNSTAFSTRFKWAKGLSANCFQMTNFIRK